MSSKVEGFAPRVQVQVPSSATPAAAAPAAEASVAAEPASTPPPANAFDGAAPTSRRVVTDPSGAPVTTSAGPQSLWGDGDGVRGPHRHDGQNVDPAKLAEWKAQRAATQGQLDDKVNHLEHKWRYTKDTTKANELWRYAHDSKKMDDPTRAKLESKLHQCDHDQAKLDQLQAKAKALGPNGGTPEQRTQLAHDIETAKKAVTTDLDGANQVISDAGLSDDHLAHAEPTIDPNAPPGPSLSQLMSSIFHLSSFIEASMFGTNMVEEYGGYNPLGQTRASVAEDAELARQLARKEDLKSNQARSEDQRSERSLADAIKTQRNGLRGV